MPLLRTLSTVASTFEVWRTPSAEVEAFGYRGMLMSQGNLIDLDDFDAERYNRTPATHADYINNFIFLPVGAKAVGR